MEINTKNTRENIEKSIAMIKIKLKLLPTNSLSFPSKSIINPIAKNKKPNI